MNNSALSGAATAGHTNVVKSLVECAKMAEELAKPSSDGDPIIGAFINGHHDIVTILMEYPSQQNSLEEYLNMHLSSYQEENVNKVTGFGADVFYVKCEEHPIPFPSMELYKKSCAFLKQPVRELEPKEKALITKKRETGALKNDAEVTKITRVLNIPGTKLNKNMTSVDDAIKVRRKFIANA